ncbi:ATP-binding protein [Colwellia psychrerythraea]|uniref:ATP-binding protein n=1 Tax=Colwellia psychrerythraea TaxID=28229 RepID=UPI00051A2944|nr:ATP-binding protein [Colwellia psychrerythraea]
MFLSTEEQAYSFSAQVKQASINLGFDSFQSSLISLAVSEITINAVRYANGAKIHVYKTTNQKGLSILVEDTGPGIKNIKQAMASGYSTHNSLGLGLAAAKRTVDKMVINTSSKGTAITLTSYLPIPREVIDIGSVSFPKMGEYYKRDNFCIKTYQGECILIALFDSYETKTNVQAALLLINTFINEHYDLPLKELVIGCHRLLKGANYTRSMDMGLLRITPSSAESLIVGNISITTLLPTSNPIQKLSGGLGSNFPPSLIITHIKLSSPFCFALHSNGIDSVSLPKIDTLALNSKKHAEHIFDNHARADDDATIIVIKSYE